jgi:hypothetical protein
MPSIYLLNSAVMPVQGTYIIREVPLETFKVLVTLFYKSGKLKSFIGYEQNRELIFKWTGVNVEINRGELRELEDGDILLIMRLKYRLKDPSMKGQAVGEDDFEFFVALYRKEANLSKLNLEVGI